MSGEGLGMESTTSNRGLQGSDPVLGKRAARIDGFEQALLAQTVHSVVWDPGGVEPRRIDRYTILRRLGAGGMGVVYAAYDQELDRKVALKLVRPEQACDEDAQERLLREARAMARLSHRNIVQIYEVGRLGADIYLAMEFIEGRTLDAWLAERSRDLNAILDVFLEAGEALAAAHETGLVHRDFKPSNVLVSDRGRVVVIDFGLARASSMTTITTSLTVPAASAVSETTGTFAGTPAYMSPEQFQAERPDARSDQFSYCVALFEAIVGVRPFACATHEQIIAWMSGAATPHAASRLPAAVRATILRGLRIAPAHRWPSMPALLGHLRRVTTRRRRLLQFVVAVALLVTVIALLGALWQVVAERAATERRTVTLQTLREVEASLPARDLADAVLRADDLEPTLPAHRSALARLHEELLPQATLFISDDPADTWFLDDGRVAVQTRKSLHLWNTATGRFDASQSQPWHPAVRSASGRRMALFRADSHAIFLNEIDGDSIATQLIEMNVSSVGLPNAAGTFLVLDRQANVSLIAPGRLLPLTARPLVAGIPFLLDGRGDAFAMPSPRGPVLSWDLRDANPRPQVLPDSVGATPVLFSGDSRYLVASRQRTDAPDGSGEILLWRLAPGDKERLPLPPEAPGLAVGFAGACLIRVDHEGSVDEACDHSDKFRIRTLGSLPGIRDAAISVDGRWLAVTHRDGAVSVHILLPGLEKIVVLRQESSPARLSWDPFSPRLLTTSEVYENTYRLRTWDLRALRDARPVAPPGPGGETHVQIAGGTVLLHRMNGQPTLIRSAESRQLPHADGVVSVTLDAAGTRAFTLTERGELRCWELPLARWEPAWERIAQVEGATVVVAAPAGDRVGLIDAAGALRVLSANGKMLNRIAAGAPMRAVRWSQDGQSVLGVTADRLYRIDPANPEGLTDLISLALPEVFLDMQGDRLFEVSGSGALRLSRFAGSAIEHIVEHRAASPVAVAWSRDPALVAHADVNGDVFVWDSLQPKGDLAAVQRFEDVTALAFSQDSDLLVVGTKAGIRIINRVHPERPPGPLLGPQHVRALIPETGEESMLAVHDTGAVWRWSVASLRDAGERPPKICIPASLRSTKLLDRTTSIASDCETPAQDMISNEFNGIGRAVDATRAGLLHRRVRLRGMVSAEHASWNEGGVLWLRFDAANDHSVYFINTQADPVQDAVWREVYVEGDVGPEVGDVVFGVFTIGNARAKFRDLSLEIQTGEAWVSAGLPDMRIEDGIGPAWFPVGSPESGEIDVRDGALIISYDTDRPWVRTRLMHDARHWQALRIHVWARVAPDVAQKPAKLFLGSGSEIGDLKSSTAIDATEWRRYTVRQDVGPRRRPVILTVGLPPGGRVWIDEVTAEGKRNDGMWESIPLQNPAFENGTAGWSHSPHASVRLSRAAQEGRYALEVGSQ